MLLMLISEWTTCVTYNLSSLVERNRGRRGEMTRESETGHATKADVLRKRWDNA